MDKRIKILCVCNKGNVRSVATKYCLNLRGYNNVIAVGCTLVSTDTMKLLCDWADIILLAKYKHILLVPVKERRKVNKNFKIGEDTYGTPLDYALFEVINHQLELIEIR